MVKTRWANLRSQYRREKRKIDESKRSAAGGDVYIPKWVHLKILDFLQSTGDEMASQCSMAAPERGANEVCIANFFFIQNDSGTFTINHD